MPRINNLKNQYDSQSSRASFRPGAPVWWNTEQTAVVLQVVFDTVRQHGSVHILDILRLSGMRRFKNLIINHILLILIEVWPIFRLMPPRTKSHPKFTWTWRSTVCQPSAWSSVFSARKPRKRWKISATFAQPESTASRTRAVAFTGRSTSLWFKVFGFGWMLITGWNVLIG